MRSYLNIDVTYTFNTVINYEAASKLVKGNM